MDYSSNIVVDDFIYAFLPFLFANNLSIKKRDLNIFGWNGKIKREISLEVYSDIKNVKKKGNDTDDDIINVCGNEKGLGCSCNVGELSCTNGDLRTLNLRPIVEDFVIETVQLLKIKNLTLEKDKILPGNEKTIKKITFTEINFIKVDNNIFDNFTFLESLFFDDATLSSLNKNILTEKLGNTLLEFGCVHCSLRNVDLTVFKNLILSLFGCNLTDLNDDTFEHLTNLETLEIGWNRFSSIPSTFKYLTNLNYLSFDFTKLERLKKNDFALNKKLKSLDFSFTLDLKIVEDCAFCNLKNLKEVNFRHCSYLSYINQNAFGTISNGYAPLLKVFNIGECNISVLHENLLDWKNVEKLYFTENPFACNCSMAWLFNDLMSKNSIYEKKLIHWVGRQHHHKFYFGCLGPLPTTPNHTFPYTIVENFSSCKNNSSSPNNFLYFLSFFGLIALAVIFVYLNKLRLGNLLPRFF